MKAAIHPEYHRCVVTCACGNTFETRSTVDQLQVESARIAIPSIPAQQRLVDTAGRVERFNRKYGHKEIKPPLPAARCASGWAGDRYLMARLAHARSRAKFLSVRR